MASSLIDLVQPYTKTSRVRLEAMFNACRKIEIEGVAGDIVECGVWRGGNIILARMLCPNRTCWGYDTFWGMHNRCELDVTWGGKTVDVGKSAVSLEAVRTIFDTMGVLDDNRIRLVAGPVEETLRQSNLPERIALLRLDTDWYESTKIELEVLWPRLVPGGVLIVDDYGHWLGARRAVDEYFDPPIQFTKIDYTAVMAVKK